MATLHYHGHSAFTVRLNDGTRLVIDPFFAGSPVADLPLADVEADYVLCTHGHGDHFADALPLVRRTGAMLISTFEIIEFANQEGVKNTHALHIGGGYEFPFGRVQMTPALHGGQVHGDDGRWTTVPGGFLMDLDGRRVYHAGDTALLTDMQLLRGRVDVAVLPIGDNYTMGPEEAARAVEMIRPEVVIPMHYNTIPVIEQDPHAFAALVGGVAEVVIMESGDDYELTAGA